MLRIDCCLFFFAGGSLSDWLALAGKNPGGGQIPGAHAPKGKTVCKTDPRGNRTHIAPAFTLFGKGKYYTSAGVSVLLFAPLFVSQ